MKLEESIDNITQKYTVISLYISRRLPKHNKGFRQCTCGFKSTQSRQQAKVCNFLTSLWAAKLKVCAAKAHKNTQATAQISFLNLLYSCEQFPQKLCFLDLEIVANSNSCRNICKFTYLRLFLLRKLSYGKKLFKAGNYSRKYGKLLLRCLQSWTKCFIQTFLDLRC